MRYVYQQILAFFAIILITVGTMGIIFVQYITTNVYNEKEEQLFGYAESVIKQNMTIQELERGAELVTNQDVSFAIFNAKDEMLYPKADNKYSSGISAKDFALLEKGNRISLTHRDKGFMNEDVSFVTVYLPLFNKDTAEFTGFIAVGSPVSGIQSKINEIHKNLWIAVFISTGLAIALSLAFANYLTRRINRMRKATREIAAGNFDISLENHHKDEFDELSEDFNQMAVSLKASNEEIQRQENVRRQFMMDVAHEMRTPLTTINGILEGLQHDMIPEKSRNRSMELMQKEAKRLIRLVNENLDYEKIRSNQIVLVKQEFSAKEALENVADQLQEKAKAKGNQIHVDAGADMKIYADYDRFIQILVNLTQNAIQFTANGDIYLAVSAEENYQVITVKDTGIGIEKKDITSIWERFYKVDVSRKNTKFGESGIGLAVVHSLVLNHKGMIDVESTPGAGTTFTIKFPKKAYLEKMNATEG
ncbi:Hypothetical protein Tpal_2322 [Trichococcus palustris]|jgi:signal transduction histidine kinase|uniref:histidine kinase n=1 Tax=Trichococcus palustris TaxID=140314 RepID=A0A143YWB1_9LACT|nr:HAMP domain-containing sensor histidine kinase [Trichococcus palustris]CZQ99080.1 Hypothetical protein Tpal_2322 [Trichococcus palustris]SFK88441.1 Signal transduction histidine kinase [Trichococcus palustris]